jgi:hypothetical protein
LHCFSSYENAGWIKWPPWPITTKAQGYYGLTEHVLERRSGVFDGGSSKPLSEVVVKGKRDSGGTGNTGAAGGGGRGPRYFSPFD